MNEEMKKLAEELNAKFATFEQTTKSLDEALKGKAPADKIESLQKSADALKTSIDALAKQQDEIEVKMQQAGSYKSPISFAQALRKELVTMAGKDMRSQVKAAGAGGHGFQMKTGTPLTIATNFGAMDLDTAIIEPVRIPGVGKSPDRPTSILDIVSAGAIGTNQITWAERTARTEGAAAKAENTVFGESKYTYQIYKAAIEKHPVFTKVVEESLNDIDWLVSEITMEHMAELRRLLEYQLLNGDGTAPNIQGVIENAAAYTSVALSSVPSPNTYDAARAAINQLRTSFYNPSHIVMNPADVAAMELLKDSTVNYQNLVINGRIWGLPVVESTLITAGQMLVGDFSKVKIFYKGGMEVRLYDQNESDPLYGLYTLVSKVYAGTKLQHADYSAFLYDAISDITTAIS